MTLLANRNEPHNAVARESAYERLTGETPLVFLQNLSKRLGLTVFGKCEFLNPGGSIKDRIARHMIDSAEKAAIIAPRRSTIVEATGGNTGAALASICALRGYSLIVTMSSKMSREKVDCLRAWGAEVVICPYDVRPDSPEYFINCARSICEGQSDRFFINQFNNPENVEAHFSTTAREIWRQCPNPPQLIVAGAGTGGTLMGCARYRNRFGQCTKLLLADPAGSVIAAAKNGAAARPSAYDVEGIGGEEVPPLLDIAEIDFAVTVSSEDTYQEQLWMMQEEGLFLGGSSCCAIAALARFSEAADIDPIAPIVVFLCDGGRAYLDKFTKSPRKHGDLI